MSFTFKAFAPGDNSRLEVDLGVDAGPDRNNFLVIENTASGIRIATAEPLTDGNWETGAVDNDFTAFTGNRTITDGVDNTAAHTLTMELTFVDGQDNDVIKLYLDGVFIGTTTTFENYRDFHLGQDHVTAAEANQVSRLLFRGSAGGAPTDGAGGQNQGFTFDNITYATFNSTGGASATGNELANVIVGNLDGNVITGLGGADTMSGGGGNDVFVFTTGAEHAAGEIIDGGNNGAGDDFIRFTSTTDGDTLVLTSGVTNVETVQLGTATGDTSGIAKLNVDASAVDATLTTIDANDGDNVITGSAFATNIYGHAGDDTIAGGDGDDTIWRAAKASTNSTAGPATIPLPDGIGSIDELWRGWR